MKKILFLLLLAFTVTVTNAQNYYKSTTSELYLRNSKTNDWDLYQKNSDVNITVVIEDSFLTIEANSPTMYKLFRNTAKKIYGKTYEGNSYDAIDLKKNTTCTIDVIIFNDGGYLLSIFQDGDYNLRYYLKSN